MRHAYRHADLLLKKVNYELRNSGLFFQLGKNLLWVELHLLDLDGQGGGSSNHISVNLSTQVSAASSVSYFKPHIKAFSQPTIDSDFNEEAAKLKLQQQQREAQATSTLIKPKEVEAMSPPQEIDDEEMKMISKPQA